MPVLALDDRTAAEEATTLARLYLGGHGIDDLVGGWLAGVTIAWDIRLYRAQHHDHA